VLRDAAETTLYLHCFCFANAHHVELHARIRRLSLAASVAVPKKTILHFGVEGVGMLIRIRTLAHQFRPAATLHQTEIDAEAVRSISRLHVEPRVLVCLTLNIYFRQQRAGIATMASQWKDSVYHAQNARLGPTSSN
jgi:hypothetical protein